jgi:hypothetical protein
MGKMAIMELVRFRIIVCFDFGLVRVFGLYDPSSGRMRDVLR